MRKFAASAASDGDFRRGMLGGCENMLNFVSDYADNTLRCSAYFK